jgi:hypothetical protein
MLHPPILVALAKAMDKVNGNLILMSLVLTLLGYGLSLVAADICRRIPLLKSVL